MNFFDFKQSDLVGKLVLYSTSENVVNSDTREITSITYSDKQGFTIKGHEGKFFNYRGQQVAIKCRVNWHGISRCRLISEQEALELQSEIALTDQKKQLIDIIINNKEKLMSVETRFLKTLANKINNME